MITVTDATCVSLHTSELCCQTFNWSRSAAIISIVVSTANEREMIMTNASPEQIAAKQAQADAKNANVERVAKGLPQIASKPTGKTLSIQEILKKRMGSEAPTPKAGKQETAMAKSEFVRKVCPELLDGLVTPDGKARLGTLVHRDPEGKDGRKGGVYVMRFVRVTKPLAKFILEKFGHANRTSTKAKLTKYTAAMDVGIGGNSGPKGWNFTFQSAIFTVDTIGSVSGLDLEQHNGAHGFKSLLACADPNATALYVFCFGVPKELRDNIDNNQARTSKDIASTRTELKDMFAVGSMIGGIVKITNEAMQTRCIGLTTQTVTIVNNIRNGEQAKTGGSQGVDADVLDRYSDAVGKCVQGIVGLDSVCGFKTTNKAGLEVTKTSGGLTRLYTVNHLAAVQCLAGSYLDEGNVVYSEEMGNQVLDCYSLLANDNETDLTEPMVFLRNQIFTWDKNNQHQGSSGRNVKFAALKMAVCAQLSGEKIANMQWLSKLNSKSQGPKLEGMGIVHVAETQLGEDGEAMVGEDGEAIIIDREFICGIDDYVDESVEALSSAGTVVAANDATLEQLEIDDTEADDTDSEEMTEETDDTPSDDSDELEEI